MRYLSVIILLFMLSGCSRYIRIERSERFVSRQGIKQKIICIDPQVRLMGYTQNDSEEEAELENWFRDELNYSASKNQVDLEIVRLTPESTTSYYEDLLSLKKEFLQANNLQNTPLNFSNQNGYNTITKSVFVYPPLIAHDFTDLSKKYGTPYFSYIGIYKQPRRILYYHLIVNTNTAETVYRELKSISKGSLKKKMISQMVYDSMAMLKEELK